MTDGKFKSLYTTLLRLAGEIEAGSYDRLAGGDILVGRNRTREARSVSAPICRPPGRPSTVALPMPAHHAWPQVSRVALHGFVNARGIGAQRIADQMGACVPEWGTGSDSGEGRQPSIHCTSAEACIPGRMRVEIGIRQLSDSRRIQFLDFCMSVNVGQE